uniref:RAB11 family interacting protein 4 (class II) a n=1 Tax=Oryzias latipes TaxID=8090 RepID=A0A3P9J875_ORYLA
MPLLPPPACICRGHMVEEVRRLAKLNLFFWCVLQVKKLTRHLYPNAHGKINFKDFCHAVFAIKGCEGLLKAAVGPRLASRHPSVTDNGHVYQAAEANPAPPIIMCTRPYPECSASSEECDMDSSADARGPSQRHSLLNGSASVISGEEQFEDYGEGVDVDFTPSSPCPEEDSHTNGFSDLGSSLPSRSVANRETFASEPRFSSSSCVFLSLGIFRFLVLFPLFFCSGGQTPQKMGQLYNSDLLDIYCSQCCKKVNLLNDLEARLKNLKATSPNRKISSTAFGRQLFQANHSVFGSSQGSSTEDLFADSYDPCDLDITPKVGFLERKVTELESDSLANSDLKSKLKQENTHLVHRVHELEEQVKDSETKTAESLKEEMKRHREAFSKMERDRNSEIDLLFNRVQQLEDENGEMTLNVCRLKSQTEKLDQEKQKISDKLEDTSLRLKDELDLYRKIMDKVWQNRRDFQKEKESTQELVDDLRRELDYLQIFKSEMEHPGKGKGLSEFSAKTMEMEHEVRRLKQENFKLHDQNDDLNAQILSLSLYEARNLFSCNTKAQCLAAEIDNASRDELVDALKEQEEINLRLKQYMDKIILAILDHNPSILEIKN